MTLSEKIDEISFDAKQAEQIHTIFDIGFEMGFVFAETGRTKRSDADYHRLRNLYIEVAGPVMTTMFNEMMKDYEKTKRNDSGLKTDLV